jgi:urease accessory protein
VAPAGVDLFDGARASIALRVELAPDARFFGWEVTCLGRTASNERFTHGSLRQSLDLVRDGALVSASVRRSTAAIARSNPVQS